MLLLDILQELILTPSVVKNSVLSRDFDGEVPKILDL
jgi:hypothetical protein